MSVNKRRALAVAASLVGIWLNCGCSTDDEGADVIVVTVGWSEPYPQCVLRVSSAGTATYMPVGSIAESVAGTVQANVVSDLLEICDRMRASGHWLSGPPDMLAQPETAIACWNRPCWVKYDEVGRRGVSSDATLMYPLEETVIDALYRMTEAVEDSLRREP